MATLEASIIINRPAEEVFAAVTDYKSLPQWSSGLLKAEITSPGPLGIGSTYTYNMKVMGRTIDTTGEIVAYDPPTTYAWKATSAPFPLSGSVLCEAIPEGTRLTQVVEAEPGGFFKIAEPLLLKQPKDQSEKDLKRLKELHEGGLTSLVFH